jgi:hypothetical protein
MAQASRLSTFGKKYMAVASGTALATAIDIGHREHDRASTYKQMISWGVESVATGIAWPVMLPVFFFGTVATVSRYVTRKM